MIRNLHFFFINTLHIQNNFTDAKFSCDLLINYKDIEEINILFIY